MLLISCRRAETDTEESFLTAPGYDSVYVCQGRDKLYHEMDNCPFLGNCKEKLVIALEEDAEILGYKKCEYEFCLRW